MSATAKTAQAKAAAAVEKTKAAAASASAGKDGFLHTPVMRAALPFINGGLAGVFATICIQPMCVGHNSCKIS